MGSQGEGRAARDPEGEIIRLLRATDEGYTSGQEISRKLGISRAAVWKHIESLRKLGYAIEAGPSKGYRLREAGPAERPYNGVEIASSLDTDLMGRRVVFLEETGSTNAVAVELARAGETEGTVIVADAQTSGRGRMGRTWSSPPGVNVYTSVILRPRVAPRSASELTFVAAVAAAEAVGAFSPVRPAVKWPNDILIEGRKVAGILLEMESETDRVRFVVVGLGINVNSTPDTLPPELRKTATSIREKTGSETPRLKLLAALYSALEKWYKIYINEGFSPVAEAWRTYFPSEGKSIRVDSFGRTVEGVCMGIDSDGSLLVRTGSGEVERVVSGDMEPGEPGPDGR